MRIEALLAHAKGLAPVYPEHELPKNAQYIGEMTPELLEYEALRVELAQKFEKLNERYLAAREAGNMADMEALAAPVNEAHAEYEAFDYVFWLEVNVHFQLYGKGGRPWAVGGKVYYEIPEQCTCPAGTDTDSGPGFCIVMLGQQPPSLADLEIDPDHLN